MDQIFCTIFDSNYLDKGLVLYDSMVKHIGEFKLYVFAFDDKCYEILKSENYDNMVVIPLSEFETDDLLRVKKERTRAEYCWTCSSWSIRHVLEHYNEPICTYIDADMAFFSSPQPVFDDMKRKKCSIIIVPHRYETEGEEKKNHDLRGSYCVQFNTFVNNEDGRKALKWWSDKCLEWCYYSVPGTTEWYGDQKYLNVFPEKFDGVYICNHYGVGLAPWNNKLVDYYDDTSIRVKKTREVFPIVIYHFESVAFLTKHIINANSHTNSKLLRQALYDQYIKEIIDKRKYIKEKYNHEIVKLRRVVTSNPLMKVYQKYFAPIRRIRRLSDLYWIKGDTDK